MEYSLYGTMTYRIGTNDTSFLFDGRDGVMADPNGLLYMKARYYNPYLCRFVNPDPTGFKGGLNFYAAFNGNPITYLDPSGMSGQSTGESAFSWTPRPINTTLTYDNNPGISSQGDSSTFNVTSGTPSDTSSWSTPWSQSQAQSGQGQNSGGTSFYDAASTTIGATGVGASVSEVGFGGATIGDNGVIYWSGWGGGSRGMITTYEIAPFFKGAGGFLAGLGFAADTYGVLNGDISPTHYVVNTGVGATALYVGGVPGAIIGGAYFMIDQVNSETNGWSEIYNNVLDGLYGPSSEGGDPGDP